MKQTFDRIYFHHHALAQISPEMEAWSRDTFDDEADFQQATYDEFKGHFHAALTEALRAKISVPTNPAPATVRRIAYIIDRLIEQGVDPVNEEYFVDLESAAALTGIDAETIQEQTTDNYRYVVNGRVDGIQMVIKYMHTADAYTVEIIHGDRVHFMRELAEQTLANMQAPATVDAIS